MDTRGLVLRPQLLPDGTDRLLVVAPAGFGKTSLLRQWVGERSSLWFTAAPLPPERPQLLGGLARLLNLKDEPLEVLLPRLHGQAVVLDDLQWLEAPEDRQALEALIEASDHFPLALGSRTEPHLAALHRRRVRRQLTEVSAQELGFQGAELETWMAQMLPQPLAPETRALLESRTQGWAAALVLAAQRLSGLPPAQWHQAVSRLSGNSQTLYDYLALEFLETLPEPLRAFLLESSVLPWLEPTPENQRFLRELERRRLLLPTPEGGFCFHALLTEFLQARFEETAGRAVFLDHCDQEAQRLWEHGAWEAAFRLWWNHGFPEKIAAAIAETGAQRPLDYFPWVKLLPRAVLARHPRALRLRGIAETETHGPDAEAILQEAEALLPPEEQLEAQLARVRIYRYRNQWERVGELLETLQSALVAPTALRIRWLQERAFWQEQVGARPQAVASLEEAVALLPQVEATPVQRASVLVQRATMADLWQGNFTRVREALGQIEQLFAPRPPAVILAFLTEIECELAFQQRSPDAARLYQQLSERAQAVGYSGFVSLAEHWLALETARQGHATTPLVGESPGSEYALLPELIRLYDPAASPALQLPERALTLPGRCLLWLLVEPLLQRGERTEALRLAELAYQAAVELENTFAQLMACYWSLQLRPGRARLAECLSLVRERHDEAVLLRQPGCLRLLTRALAEGVETEYVRALLAMQNPTRAWCLRGFGGLQIESLTGPVRWPRPKARALFALLWLAEGKRQPIERVIAALWPDAEPEKARQSYRTHCTYLRQALGEGCLESTQELVRLLLPEAHFDERALLTEAHRSDDPMLWEQALEAVGEAEFLPEFTYDDWAQAERERLHRLRQELRLRLAHQRLAHRDPEAALALGREVLREDPCDEDAALVGITALIALERLGEARVLWTRFLSNLTELGLRPTLAAHNVVRKLGLS